MYHGILVKLSKISNFNFSDFKDYIFFDILINMFLYLVAFQTVQVNKTEVSQSNELSKIFQSSFQHLKVFYVSIYR